MENNDLWAVVEDGFASIKCDMYDTMPLTPEVCEKVEQAITADKGRFSMKEEMKKFIQDEVTRQKIARKLFKASEKYTALGYGKHPMEINAAWEKHREKFLDLADNVIQTIVEAL